MSSVPKLSFVIGGARSGKSRYAEGLIAALPPAWTPPWAYVATAEALDNEMAERIAAHRARRGPDWRTIEAPRELAAALAAHAKMPVLVDCLTLWLSNLMLAQAERIVTALEDLGLSTWYRSLPQGLDTELGSDGEGLSAGEAQLLWSRLLASSA